MAVQTPREILVEARNLLAVGFTKGAFAVDVDGAEVNYDSEKACAFCSLGAIKRVSENVQYDELSGFMSTPYARALWALNLRLRGRYDTLVSFNDQATQQQVLVMFDEAIASLP